MKNILLSLSVVAMLMMVGCGSSSSSSDSVNIPETDYVAAAEAVAPAFTAPSVSISAQKAASTWGYRSYEIAVVFAKDTTEFGTNNVYYNAKMAQNIFDDFRAKTDLADYAFSTAFTEPFFGIVAAYQYAGNYSSEGDFTGGSAIKKDDDGTVHVLSTSARDATSSSGEEVGAMKASYQASGKSLTMDIVQYVDYSGGVYQGSNTGKFIMRMQVEGNAETHSFDSLKIVKYNSTEGAYYLNIVGKGVSQGTAQYFLFRITDERGSDATPATDGYFCIAADSLTAGTNFDTPQTESEIEDGNCAGYLADVKAMTPFVVDTDLPAEAFDVGIQNAKEFVMWINPTPSP